MTQLMIETGTDKNILQEPDSILSTQLRFVLFVDDDEKVLKSLQRALRSETYLFIGAHSGDEALKIISEKPVQVIVADMHMPEMDGVTLLSLVEQRAPDVIRLALSGQSDACTIIDAINSGSIYRYILKPWDNDQLKITIRQAIDLWELQAERRYLLATLTAHNQHLEEMVSQRTRQILAAQRHADIGRYSSQIVHNLRTPLNTVFAAIDLLFTLSEKQGLSKEDLGKWLGMARSAANDLRDIIAGILIHAREKESFELVPIDINRLIEKEVTFFEMMPEFKYDVQKKVLLNSANPQINGNPVHIKQILVNLIKNALDAMESVQEKQLTIETSVINEMIEIRVSDTGEGIAKENIPRIFSSNFTTKSIDKGTGLGLASVQAMVNSYAGHISVESDVGKGTTFKVRLPALKTDDS